MKRLELAGIARRQAEAIAAEINLVRGGRGSTDLDDQVITAIDRMTMRLGLVTAVIVSLASTVLGILLSR